MYIAYFHVNVYIENNKIIVLYKEKKKCDLSSVCILMYINCQACLSISLITIMNYHLIKRLKSDNIECVSFKFWSI